MPLLYKLFKCVFLSDISGQLNPKSNFFRKVFATLVWENYIYLAVRLQIATN
jgi:hypothetical protein